MTSAHRVLLIPELLDIIFHFLGRGSNAKNARVCSQWSEIALNVVWKEVDNILHLFRLLKPIKSEPYHHHFRALPQASDWAKFDKYASRVRSLKFQSSKQDISPVLDDVARTRTSFDILPNTHTLEWLYSRSDHLERCKLFLHPRLRHLSITSPAYDPPRPEIYSDFCARTPHLQTLTLFVSLKPIHAELRILLQNLPELTKIVLPEFHYTSTVVEVLSRANNIAILDLDQSITHSGDPANVTPFSPVLKEGAFPCLHELNLSARVDDVDRFFSSRFAPTRITRLYLNSYAYHTPAEVHALFITLSQHCSLLKELHIRLYHRDLPLNLPTDQRLSYDTLKPLFTLAHLTTFELVHKYPLKITHDDIDDLARRWPHLESLVLNAEPLWIDEDVCTLGLRALLPFAQHCPRLRVLGLYLNATVVEIPSAHVSLEPFGALRTLNVGTSQVHDTSAAVAFLSRICPLQCRLETSISWTEFGPEVNRKLPSELVSELRMRCEAWHVVDELLPPLVRLRREEKERMRALQAEVEDLRVRNRLLTDTVDTKTRDSCIIV